MGSRRLGHGPRADHGRARPFRCDYPPGHVRAHEPARARGGCPDPPGARGPPGQGARTERAEPVTSHAPAVTMVVADLRTQPDGLALARASWNAADYGQAVPQAGLGMAESDFLAADATRS